MEGRMFFGCTTRGKGKAGGTVDSVVGSKNEGFKINFQNIRHLRSDSELFPPIHLHNFQVSAVR